MAAYSFTRPPYDLENAASYTPIPDQPADASSIPACHQRSKKLLAGILFSSVFLLSLILLFVNQQSEFQTKVNGTNQGKSSTPKPISPAARTAPPSRGVSQGVSEKTFRLASGENATYAGDAFYRSKRYVFTSFYLFKWVGGYTQVYEGNLTFATVRGAGHQVPSYQPVRALSLIMHFLGGTGLPNSSRQ